ncbi:Putative flippase GtrA (transmembrane translocase of bactoprenol-linked glucose) [Mariprofundus aestuarium]|uniref:Flippase GtrA (Transmembrane translocase of bactoprenol-linked glucose) n=2 Tax=Mariprofundus aestuarium TaxID=1921086 RepID=A0A2K8L247_MARES|nr:Putative flippase GtrA (transmembrane translocase of bactoprenol-linked glucose) [Mariprofundus aestuarium]
MVFSTMKFTLRKEVGQVLRFGLVGIMATVTHVITVLFLVEWGGWGPLWANFVAFSLAVFVSFIGHYHWTFNASTPYATAFPKFFTIALLGLGLNQAIMFSLVNLLGWDYRLGLAAVIMVVPAITFLASRFWAFQPAHR